MIISLPKIIDKLVYMLCKSLHNFLIEKFLSYRINQELRYCVKSNNEEEKIYQAKRHRAN